MKRIIMTIAALTASPVNAQITLEIPKGAAESVAPIIPKIEAVRVEMLKWDLVQDVGFEYKMPGMQIWYIGVDGRPVEGDLQLFVSACWEIAAGDMMRANTLVVILPVEAIKLPEDQRAAAAIGMFACSTWKLVDYTQ